MGKYFSCVTPVVAMLLRSLPMKVSSTVTSSITHLTEIVIVIIKSSAPHAGSNSVTLSAIQAGRSSVNSSTPRASSNRASRMPGYLCW